MKKILYLFFVASLTIGFASCSGDGNEDDIDPPVSPPIEEGY